MQIIVVASGATASAITLNEWVMIVTIIYAVLQIGLLIPKYIKHWKKNVKRNKK